jgi:acetylornithine deacetylase
MATQKTVAAEDPLSEQAVLAALQELVRIPSVNPVLAPGEGAGEAEIATHVCRWFEQRGIRSWQEDAAPGRPNAVAQVGSGSRPVLVLCAHLDTVSTAGMTIPPFEPRVEAGRVYGRGSYDMKGGVTAILCAVASLAARPLRGTVMAALVADEEYASVGAQAFVAKHRADACILTEASEKQLIVAHKGFVWAEIVTRGKAAHGSRWDLGVSAIGKMGRIVAALERFDADVLRARKHALVGPASQHCALISGGDGLSTYSPECRLKIERRTLPGETPEQVMRELRDVVGACGEQAEITLLLDRAPMVTPDESPIARITHAAIEEVTGSPPSHAGVSYWMDAALFSAAGADTVNYGPSGAGAHEAVEWVDLSSVVTCARVLARAAETYCR